MILKLLNKILGRGDRASLTTIEKGLSYKPVSSAGDEMRNVEKSFARLFASEDGQRVLSYLQFSTLQKALSHSASDEQLRYVEGQRALLLTILKLIERGRKPA